VTDTLEYLCEFAESADRAVMGARRRLAAAPAGRYDPFAGANNRAAALQAMEQGREDLLRAARVALASGADRLVVRLAEAATALYFNHRHLADWIEMSRLAITAAQRLGRHDIEAQVRCTLSRAYADGGAIRLAGVEIEAALALVPAADDPVLAGTVWEFYGRHLDLVARAAPAADQPAARDRAEAAFRTAIDVYLEHDVPRGAALGRLFLGAFLDAAGRPAEALEYLRQAREGLNAADDDRNSARADAAIGAAYLHLGQYRRAHDELSAAAAYLAAAELWHYEAEVRDNLAAAAAALGDRAGAAEHARRSAEIRRLSAGGE
jgi:tetratricopeptide (TPR) repeat protein